ncbi:MAG: 4-(cytidine 5'-diphospho)-2-C-methyl-D-erythritol kinase [Thermodesulfobacteriota bacterium]|nr:4-(cytidine 5'-diphospho)-2-C-methyl-D-erythritol kinase [Thermodesulfobacteriota bacterium]
MNSFKLECPAKINLRLEVLKKREDGYHDIRSIIIPITIFDTLVIDLIPEGVIIESNSPQIPLDENNLAYKAAIAMKKLINRDLGVRIKIIKRIPVGAGLGGGSSDAAGVMLSLNKLLDLNLKNVELSNMGLEIGADVPFFIHKKNAIARGSGEKLEDIILNTDIYLVLVYPDFPVSTAWAYSKIDLTISHNNISIPKIFDSINTVVSLLRNDLEKTVISEYPEVEEIKQTLIDEGALGSLMSGSGSCVFGVFAGKKESLQAFKKIGLNKKWSVFNCKNFIYSNNGHSNGGK